MFRSARQNLWRGPRPDDRHLRQRCAVEPAGRRRLAGRGVGVRVLDLRWLAPLPTEDLIRETHATRAVLVADETRASGGWSEGVITALVDAGISTRIGRVTSKDSFIPLGDAAKLVLLSEEEIEAAAYRLLHT